MKRHMIVVCHLRQSHVDREVLEATVLMSTRSKLKAFWFALNMYFHKESCLVYYEIMYRRSKRSAEKHLQVLAELSGSRQ